MDPDTLANLPAMMPPPGEKSNFTAPPPDAMVLKVLAASSLAVALVAVVIRLYVKRAINRRHLTWDDGTCLLALCTAIVHSAMNIKNLDYGLGKHMWNIRAVSLTHDRLLSMTGVGLVMVINMFLVRISILGLYRQLFGMYKTSKRLIIVGYFISVLIALPEMGVIMGRMVECTNGVDAPSYCDLRVVSITITTFAATGLIADVYIYSIALSRLRSLQVTISKKVQLTIIFAMGFTALSFSIGTLGFVGTHIYSTDSLWYGLWAIVFKFLGTNIALTCACATFFPAFWNYHIAPLSSSVFRQPTLNFSMLVSTSGSRKADISEVREYGHSLAPSSSLESKRTSPAPNHLNFQTQYMV